MSTDAPQNPPETTEQPAAEQNQAQPDPNRDAIVNLQQKMLGLKDNAVSAQGKLAALGTEITVASNAFYNLTPDQEAIVAGYSEAGEKAVAAAGEAIDAATAAVDEVLNSVSDLINKLG